MPSSLLAIAICCLAQNERRCELIFMRCSVEPCFTTFLRAAANASSICLRLIGLKRGRRRSVTYSTSVIACDRPAGKVMKIATVWESENHHSMRKYGIVATSQTNALLQIDRLVRYDALGVANDIPESQVGMPIRTMDGSIGKLYSFEMCESQLVADSASPVYAQNLFFAEDAILFASRPLENPDGNLGVQATVITDPDSGVALRLLHSYQHLQGAHVITLDVLYGFVAMRPEHMVLLTTLP